MRRIVLFVGLLLGLVLSSAHPQGQRGPTISEDLKAALASGARVRVIVQAEGERALIAALPPGPRAPAATRRRPLARCHRERTEPPRSRRRRRAPLRRPAGRRRHGDHQQGHARGQGVGRHARTARTALAAVRSPARASASRSSTRASPSTPRSPDACRRARESRVARTGRHGRSVRPRHAHRRDHRRQRSGRHARDARSTRAAARRACTSWTSASSAATGPATRATSSPASTGRSPTRRRYGVRVINLSLGHPGQRAVRHRSVVPRRRSRRRRPGSSSSSPRATTDGRRRERRVLGGVTSPGNSPFAITVGALDAGGTVDRSRRPRRALQLARPDEVRLRGQAGRRRAGHRAWCRSRIRARG